MSVALHGNLRDFGIGEVFQLIGQQRKTGVLEMQGEGDTVAVVFYEGAVVSAQTAGPGEHAALGDLLVRTGQLSAERLSELEREHASQGGRFADLLVRRAGLTAEEVRKTRELLDQETIFVLLRWRSGSFHFRPESVQRPDASVRLLPAEEILMDGLRMLDEWRTLDADATRDDAVFQQSGPFQNYAEWAASEAPARRAAAEELFESVDGRLSVRRLADLSRAGTFETARLLTDLRRSGVIEVVDPASLPRASRSRPSIRGLAGAALSRLGALAPFAVLALFALLGFASPAPAPAPEAGRFELPREVRQAARSDRVTARLRNLAEVHRWVTGSWPRGPEELEQRGWIDAGTLAAAGSGPYHWSSGEDGLLILAPER